MKTPIYFDYNATTPVDQRVIAVMQKYLGLEGVFGNPSSANAHGKVAKVAVEKARSQVAGLINAVAEEIIFTASATEAINLALKGAAQFYQRRGKHIITINTEHKAVLKTCQQLKKEGFEVTVLKVDHEGLLDLNQLVSALRSDTILISLMHVNNEIGVIHDIAAIGRLARERGIILHVDAVQSAGRLPIDVKQMQIDLMSFSAHKCYGPKGIGALYLSREPKIHLVPQILGAGQEFGLRAGTLATHQIVGMGLAFEILQQEMATEILRVQALRDRLWLGIKDLDSILLNGSLTQRAANNLNVSFANVQAEALLMALRELSLSTGAACSSASIDASHVLTALGRPDHVAHSSLRISLGRYTTQEEVDYAIALINREVTRLQNLSALKKVTEKTYA